MKEQTVETLGALAVYAVLYGVWNASGGAFHVWPDLWQLMPWPALATDLGGAMLDLHSQPPILNLIFGAALQASIAARISMESLLQPFFFLLGGATVVALVGLARQLVARRGVRVAVVLLFLANPYFYASLHYLFYTPIELLLLLLGGWLGFRFLDRPSPGRLAAALAPALLLVHARSMFHPLWLVLLIGLLLGLARPRLPMSRGAHRRGAVLAIALAWPAKNLARFGFFGFSSWSGMSIARGLPTGEPLLPSGYQARLGAFARTSNEPPVPGSVERAARMVPPEFRDRPALAAVAKPDGSPNWNHYALIPLSRELGAAALATLRDEPSLLFLKAADFYANGYAVYEATLALSRRILARDDRRAGVGAHLRGRRVPAVSHLRPVLHGHHHRVRRRLPARPDRRPRPALAEAAQLERRRPDGGPAPLLHRLGARPGALRGRTRRKPGALLHGAVPLPRRGVARGREGVRRGGSRAFGPPGWPIHIGRVEGGAGVRGSTGSPGRGTPPR